MVYLEMCFIGSIYDLSLIFVLTSVFVWLQVAAVDVAVAASPKATLSLAPAPRIPFQDCCHHGSEENTNIPDYGRTESTG